MKKQILAICLLVIAVAFQASAQCVPNTSITVPGIYPDSATGLSPGVVGQAYSQVMQMRVPNDTMVAVSGVGTVNVTIDDITLQSFTALPPGLTYSKTPTSGVFPGGSNGCVLISGTPTTAGTYHPKAITATHGHYLIFNQTQIDTIDYYTIVITSTSTGLALLENPSTFSVGACQPNPASDFTVIPFSVPTGGQVGLTVYNMIGQVKERMQISAATGLNEYRLSTKELEAGIYIYSLEAAGKKLSGRLVVSH